MLSPLDSTVSASVSATAAAVQSISDGLRSWMAYWASLVYPTIWCNKNVSQYLHQAYSSDIPSHCQSKP